MLWMFSHFLVFGQVFAMVSESPTVNLVPRVLFIFVLYLELMLLGGPTHGNFLKVNGEGISMS